MNYENPTPKEDINYSQEHPLKEFTQLVIGLSALLIVAVIVLSTTVGYLAKYIPIEYEQKMIAQIGFGNDELDDIVSDQDQIIQQRLQSLANKLMTQMDLPDGASITVHYSSSDTVNALATLGGNVIFFKGLLEKIETEEELAAVMAHEIAHIQHRHPIVALGKGVTLATLAGVIGGASGSNAGQWLIGNTVNLTLLQFSRSQESQSDATAAYALYKTYGHIQGAEKLFKHFSELEKRNPIDLSGGVDVFRSHPYSDDRWEDLRQLAIKNQWPTEGKLTPWQLKTIP